MSELHGVTSNRSSLERLAGKDAGQQVFGLNGWKIDEVNGGAASVLTLCAANSFKVSFLADAGTVDLLAQGLQRVARQIDGQITGSLKH